ncbi:MAG TPA: AraC family transcriptional regulator [Pseudonocardiaceae bacterium]|jgi:AraC-like DNA-binding protein|nr:AraC family transcriptional regulator [Pseudonocardiaceae bacterium]
MPTDPLSELLALVAARCVITGGLRAGGDWAMRFVPDAPVKLDAVVRGSCWLIVGEDEPIQLSAGDAVVLHNAGPTVLCSSPDVRAVEATDRPGGREDSFVRLGNGDEVAVIGGHVALDPAAADLFTSALPAVTYARAASAEAAEMRRLLEQIMAETANAQPGAGFAVDQHAQLLLLHALRIGLRGDALTHPGWLRLLADPQLRPAVALMHGDPARSWGLAGLSEAAGMSRSHFAHRFREVSGQPPLTYLAHWRIRLAERALRESGSTVAALAQRLGYATESSFSHAFARITGVSPGQYRRKHAAR